MATKKEEQLKSAAANAASMYGAAAQNNLAAQAQNARAAAANAASINNAAQQNANANYWNQMNNYLTAAANAASMYGAENKLGNYASASANGKSIYGAAEQNKAASSGTANNTNIGNAAVTGALATLNKNGNAGGNNGDNKKGGSGGNGGSGGTAAAAAPSVQESVNTGNEQTTPSAYTPSQTVLDAQAALQNMQTNKPQGYNSKYQPLMESLLSQIQGREPFKWDFNGDELFKSYADLYTQNGKQASMDAMGQAAALTGGYGNSYAQQVGNQAYDEYLRALYDKGLDFRDRAYEAWLNEGQDLYNQYGLLQNADATDYNRYMDDYNNWLNDRNFYENQRQFEESLDWDKMSTQQKYAAEWAMQILANGQMPSAEMLQAAGLSAADAQKLMAQIATAGGGTGGSKGNENSKVVYVDNKGNYYQYDDRGNKKKVDYTQVSNNDLVHNIYTEGAERRKSNKK